MHAIRFWVLLIAGVGTVSWLSAFPVLQFTSKGFTETLETVVWSAQKGKADLTCVHVATNGWSLATQLDEAVFFDNGVSSPLGFSDDATNTIAYAFAVVTCTVSVDHATLIDAPCSIRLIPRHFNDTEAFFYESQLTNTVSLSINATETNLFTMAVTPQLVEAAFDSPVPLNEIYVGGTPATAAWAQNWSGGVRELILLADNPTDDELTAVRRYLSLKHSLAIPTESDGAIVSTLNAMGIDSDGLFNTIFLVR